MGKNRWTLKKLYLIVVFAVATFAASFVLGNAITLAFGPGTSGVMTILVTTILVVICANIVDKIGTFTLLVTLFTLLAIPTNMFGPPGPQKVVIGLITGLVYDLMWLLTGKKKYSLPIAAALSTAVSILLIFGLMFYIGHPKADFMKNILKYLIPVYALLGFIGGEIGNRIYNKTLSNLSIIKQFKS